MSPTITLTLPVAGTNVAAGLHATNYANLQTLLNGVLDNTNIAAAAGIGISKLAGYPTDATKLLKGDGTWGSRRVLGHISGAGAIIAGTRFTVVRNSAGDYTITFTTAFGDPPVVLVNSSSDVSARIAQTSSVAAGSFKVLTFSLAGTATDLQFSFLAHEIQ